jgi:hypothetical protein
MPTPEEEVQAARKTRTIMLMAGGAASLILPLCGVVYLRLTEAGSARAPNTAVMFEHREAGEAKINVTQTVTVPSGGLAAAPQASLPGGDSSLGMVKGSNDYFQDKKAEPPAASTQAAKAPEPAPAPAPEKTVVKKGGKKPFAMPKLQGVKGFSSFKGASPKGATAPGAPDAGAGGMADMLKNVPGGADNPEIQKLLKKGK